jgi:hypothetical protein
MFMPLQLRKVCTFVIFLSELFFRGLNEWKERWDGGDKKNKLKSKPSFGRRN